MKPSLFLLLVCCTNNIVIYSAVVPHMRHPPEAGVITLADGQKLTGLNIHLSISDLNQIKAYFGIRYASLGIAHLSPGTRPAETSTTIQSKPEVTVPASPHRFSQSVASFFYEAPSGTQAKTVLPPVCPQPQWNLSQIKSKIPKPFYDRLVRLKAFMREQSEDCLTLNIYAPQIKHNLIPSKPLPVLLFVHGESYEHGSGNAYDLSVLAGFTKCIAVTMNYRLGILGFLSLRDGQSNGNFALFDLHAAIMWLRNNVASFGGDPEQITLMGYRHGAALVHLFSLSKMAQGIGGKGIKRIVLLNGSGLSPWALSSHEDWLRRQLAGQLNVTIPLPTKRRSEKPPFEKRNLPNSLPKPTRVLDILHNSSTAVNISSLNLTTKQPSVSERLIELLKLLPARKILQLQEKLHVPPFTTLLGPVMLRHLFPGFLINHNNEEAESRKSAGNISFKKAGVSKSITYLEPTLFSNVDLLVGTTEEPALNCYEYSHWNSHLADSLLNFSHALYPGNWKSVAELLKFAYMKTYQKEELLNKNSKASDGDRLKEIIELLSDGLFLAPAIQTVQLHHTLKTMESRGRKPNTGASDREPRTYFTVFRHFPVASTDLSPGLKRNLQTDEDLACYFGAPLVSPSRLEPFAETYSKSYKRISFKILQLFSNFIHSGNPNRHNLWPTMSKPSVYWPEYDNKTESYLSVGRSENRAEETSWGAKQNPDEDLVVKHSFREKQLTLWSHLLPRIAGLGGALSPQIAKISYTGNDSSLHVERQTSSGICNCTISETWAPNMRNHESHLYWLILRHKQRGEDEASSNASRKAWEQVLNKQRIDLEKEQENCVVFRSAYTFPSDNSNTGDPIHRSTHKEDPTVSSMRSTQMLQYQNFPQSKSHRNQRLPNDSTTMTSRSALLWTIAVGSILFLLNTMVFVGIYYQARQLQSKSANIITVNAQRKCGNRQDAVTPDPKATNGRYKIIKSQDNLLDQPGLPSRNSINTTYSTATRKHIGTSNQQMNPVDYSIRSDINSITQTLVGSVHDTQHRTPLTINQKMTENNWDIQSHQFELTRYEEFSPCYNE
ncbi:Neuroligin-4 X-linked protein [Fasciola gigantica]|uniref:Neuroligin-4 X-linked protein n=1 Tax=Fasciola gigantica TaxID=46835 RepID=A0A504YR79_FASGI|nr:Neuroligin-4 X-linked protein [Fasciola gigantica]